MAPDTIETFLSLAIGFAVAGLLCSGFQAFARHSLGFHLMHQRARLAALMAVPLLVFAAPFIIMRGSLRRAPAQQGKAAIIAVATIFAGFWSLMSGTVVAAGWVELMHLLT